MRIAVASDDGRTIAGHFGRARGFVICEIDGTEIAGTEFRANSFTGHVQAEPESLSHAERHRRVVEALADCAVVIARGMGPGILAELAQADVEPVVVGEVDARIAVRKYLAGTLEPCVGTGCNHEKAEAR